MRSSKFKAFINGLKSSPVITWKSTGRLQQTLKTHVEVTGSGLHSGKISSIKIFPEHAGKGRYFHFPFHSSQSPICIPASIDFLRQSPLCTSLYKGGLRIRTVEHLLSALEAVGVDNCGINVSSSDGAEAEAEIPILDGSAREWVRKIEEAGLVVAVDESGNNHERMAPYLNEPVHVLKNDGFVAAFPSPKLMLSYGIDFPEVSAIGSQWLSLPLLDSAFYIEQIAPSRTFCLYEQLDTMRKAGLIKGGSLDNAIVCSSSKGWLNPPLRFPDEPCRHKMLDLVGDLSLFARFGNQGLPVAHIVAYKGGHALHTDFVRLLNKSFKS